MEFIFEHFKTVWTVISTIALFIMFLLSKTYAKRDDLISLTTRFGNLENKVETLPNVNQLHKLQLEISELRGDLKNLEPQLNSVSKLSDLLLESKLGEKS